MVFCDLAFVDFCLFFYGVVFLCCFFDVGVLQCVF